MPMGPQKLFLNGPKSTPSPPWKKKAPMGPPPFLPQTAPKKFPFGKSPQEKNKVRLGKIFFKFKKKVNNLSPKTNAPKTYLHPQLCPFSQKKEGEQDFPLQTVY